jgi:ferritin
MAEQSFAEALNEQIANEFGAHQQYIGAAVYYDSETLPRLAAFFYRQAVEERNHAMMMVQYLLDADALFKLARDNDDFQAEQFMQWFVKEQVEEVATMTDLLTVVERSADNALLVEEYLAREGLGQDTDPTAPPAAGGAF